jgi:tetratricopeptide (TPR) repeat protein
LPALAQSPREQLNQLAAQLRSTPEDSALRERIIKLALEVKPAPAVPEEARRHFVEGSAIAKAAQNSSQQALAVQSFQEALKISPWWGDAYYNLAVAQELAGQLDPAQEALRLYILTSPGEREAREAQDRIYGINARKRLAASTPPPQPTDAELLARVNGARFVRTNVTVFTASRGDEFVDIRGKQIWQGMIMREIAPVDHGSSYGHHLLERLHY